MFFLTLLATPADSFDIAFRMFDSDRSGVLDMPEFLSMMQADAMTNIGAIHRQGTRERAAAQVVTGADPSVLCAHATFHALVLMLARVDRRGPCAPALSLSLFFFPRAQISRRSGLVALLFGKDGKGTCSFKQFKTLLHQLQSAVLQIEFFSHDVDGNDTISAEVRTGTLPAVSEGPAVHRQLLTWTGLRERGWNCATVPFESAQDFARTLIAYADINTLSQFGKRISQFNGRYGTSARATAGARGAPTPVPTHLVRHLVRAPPWRRCTAHRPDQLCRVCAS